MLKLFLISPFLVWFGNAFSQTIIWSEDFDGNGGAGSNWGVLNQDIGAQGGFANQWYVSCRENGEGAGNCGCDCNTGCGTNNNSLHLGSTTAGDIGAAYDAGGLCGFGLCTNTDRRTQSTNINTVGQSNLTLNIEYMENGQGVSDNGFIEYSTNGGTSWTTLTDPAKTTICGSGQGQWTAFSFALPVVCENIPNLRIAFRWQNNDDGLGTDPSFGIDNITITKPIALPVQLINFKAIEFENYIQVNWQTLSENNNDYFTLQRSLNGREWVDITVIKGQGFSSSASNYGFNDFDFYPTTYYRLKQTDFNGDFSFSNVISVTKNIQTILKIYPNPTNGIVNIYSTQSKILKVELYSQTGQLLLNQLVNTTKFSTNISEFNKGVYILKVITQNGKVVYKKIVLAN